MANNLDGIKKLNSEEIKENRKIVLNYIGEKDSELTKEPKPVNRVTAASNQVDSIRLNKISEQPMPAENNQAKPQKIEQEKLAKKELGEKAKLEAEKKLKTEEARKRREKLRLEEKIRTEKRIARENERREKIKRAAEIERIKTEVKLAKLKTAAKRKIKRQKAIKLFKKNLRNGLEEVFVIIKKNFVYGILYLIIFLVIGYTVFCLLVLRFKIDNSIIRKIARWLPVPAAVTSQGIINYNDWRDLINNYAGLTLVEKRNSLARWVILKNLSVKYGLPVNSPVKVLAIAFAADEDFNQVGLFRIKKISEFLKTADDLGSLSKYADESGEVIYYNNKEAAEKFGPTVLNLKTNQISDVIISGNGYYIAQTIGNKNGQLGIKYLFIGAKTLDQYISDQSAKIKIIVLAN